MSVNFAINVNVNVRSAKQGADTVRTGLDKATKSAGKLEKKLKQVVGLLGGLQATRELVSLIDSYSRLENRLRVVTDNNRELAAAMQTVEQIALRTRSSLSGTTEMFTRLAIVTERLGVSQAAVARVAETINKTVILSGSTAKEASNGIIQLSQALAAGALRGDELRSVLEQLPMVSLILQDSLGVTRGQLRKLGEEGKLTSDLIFNALQGAAGKVDYAFSEVSVTLAMAFENLRTAATVALGEFDDVVGLSEKLVQIMQALAEQPARIVSSILAAIAAYKGLKLAAASTADIFVHTTAASGKMAVNLHTMGMVGQMAFTRITMATVAFGKALLKLGVFFAVFTALEWVITKLMGFGKAADDAADGVDKLAGAHDDLALAISTARRFAQAGEEIADMQQRIDKWTQRASDTGKDYGKILGMLGNRMRVLQEKYDTIKEPITDVTQQLREELELLKMSEQQREIAGRMLKIENGLRSKGIDLQDAAFAGLKFEINSLLIAAQNQKKLNEQKQLAKEIDKQYNEVLTGHSAKMNMMGHELRMTTKEFARHSIAMRMSNALHEEHGELTLEQVNGILERAAAEAELVRLLDNKQQVMSAIADDTLTQLQLDELVANGAITHAQAQEYLANQLDKTKKEVEDLSTALWEGFAQTALSNTENAIADFVVRGKGNFKSFVTAVMEDLLRMTVRLMILLPLINALKNAFNTPAGDPGQLDFGNLDAHGNPISTLQNGGSFLVGQPTSRFPGFANGGGMTVGGNGGTDSQLVAFRASPNERVTVTRPEQSMGGGTTVNVSVHNNAPGTEARVEKGENGDYRVIVDQLKGAIAGDISRGGTGLNAALEGRYGLNGASGIQLG